MITIPAGCYIVAVSGGVDSMALLDMLRRQPHLRLVVAHCNHGIRDDSDLDEQLVAQYANEHNLSFVSTKLKLGPAASEDQARKARYAFLRQCRKKYNAEAIITAHHQDDLIETALINILRGTGWRGLAPFTVASNILRPLESTPKWQLIGYARKHSVPWHEDSTNGQENYLRNYVRHTVVPTLDQKCETWREVFLQHIRKQQVLRRKIETELNEWLHAHSKNDGSATMALRYDFIMLPDTVAYEALQQLFRNTIGNSLERRQAEAALLFIKAAKHAKVMPLTANWQLSTSIANFKVEPSVVSLKKQ